MPLDGNSLLRRGPIILVLSKNPLSMLRAEDIVGTTRRAESHIQRW